VRHADDREVAAEQGHDLTGPIPGSVDDDLAVDLVLGGIRGARRHRPAVVGMLAQADDALEAPHLSTAGAGGAGHRLRDLRRIDVAVERVPQGPDELVSAYQRVVVDELGGCQHVVVHPVGACHRRDVVELGETLGGVGEAHRAGDVVADREVGVGGQLSVQRRRVRLQLHHAPARRVRRHVAGCMPRGAGRELVAFEQHDVGHTAPGEVVQGAAPGDATADHDDACPILHVWSPRVTVVEVSRASVSRSV
jgi:hypothetical protein